MRYSLSTMKAVGLADSPCTASLWVDGSRAAGRPSWWARGRQTEAMAWRMNERRASSPLPAVPVEERWIKSIWIGAFHALCNTKRLDTVVIEEDRAACDEGLPNLVASPADPKDRDDGRRPDPSLVEQERLIDLLLSHNLPTVDFGFAAEYLPFPGDL